MQSEETEGANSELFKENVDDTMYKNPYEIWFCDLISVSLALRSVSHKHRQENDALVLRISAFTHASFIGLQERFLAYARNDDTGKGYSQKFESRDE